MTSRQDKFATTMAACMFPATFLYLKAFPPPRGERDMGLGEIQAFVLMFPFNAITFIPGLPVGLVLGGARALVNV